MKNILYNAILVRYDEIALKSNSTRKRFIKQLVKNIKGSLAIEELKFPDEDYSVITEHGRIFLITDKIEEATEALKYVFGIDSFSKVYATDWDEYTDILNKVKLFSKSIVKPGSKYAVRAKRTGKHSFKSTDLARDAGSAIYSEINNLKVDLTYPDIEIFIEIRDKRAYYFSQKIAGPGGMPLGTAGSVISLISGGIDSPVATWMIMRRGAIPILMNMNTSPFNNPSESSIVYKIVNKLARWAPGMNLIFISVPHGHALEKFSTKAPQQETCVLCKRQMLRMAEEYSSEFDALAIVTGDSLSQVASQTLTNIHVLSQAVELSILRPLIGMDKRQIVDLAKKIGTLNEKMENSGDCLAVPKYPQTAADLEWLKGLENKYLDIPEIITEAKNGVKIFKFSVENPLVSKN